MQETLSHVTPEFQKAFHIHYSGMQLFAFVYKNCNQGLIQEFFTEGGQDYSMQ